MKGDGLAASNFENLPGSDIADLLQGSDIANQLIAPAGKIAPERGFP
jgi:hypothetical protein